MNGEETKSAKLAGTSAGTLRDGEESEGPSSGNESNASGHSGSDDAAGSTSNSSSTTGDVSEGVRQSGSSEGVNEISSSTQVFEGVTAQDFSEFSDLVVSKIDGLLACNVVILFALFICAGTLIINEIVVSMRGR